MAYDNNRKLISQELLKLGWEPHQVAGFVGRLGAESNWNPKAFRANDAGKGNHSVGIGQWNRERLRGLQKFDANWKTDVRAQARYLDHELRTTHKWIGDKLKNAKTVGESLNLAIMYEGPQGSHYRKNGKIIWTPEKALGRGHTIKYAKLAAQEMGVGKEAFLNLDIKADNPTDNKEGIMYKAAVPGTGVIGDNPRAFKGDPAVDAVTAYNDVVSKVGTEGVTSVVNPANSTVASFVNGLVQANQQKQAQLAASHPSMGKMAEMFGPKLKWAEI